MSRSRRNWRQYNASLVNRGKLEMWVSEEQLAQWRAVPTAKSKRGRRFIYSTTAILACHLIRLVFCLAYRQT